MTYHPGMALLSYRTAGESHGPGVISLLEGLPRGVKVDTEWIDSELVRRQGGYGRGGRQRIERDHAEFLGGIRLGHATGAPIAILVPNKDSRLDDLERTPPVEIGIATPQEPGSDDSMLVVTTSMLGLSVGTLICNTVIFILLPAK